MSPEQLSGAKVDGRADLYALGVTLFQLLTGSLPLRADSMSELMRIIMQVDAPDVRTLNPSLPQVIAQLLAKALRKQPGDRYQTGMQMARDLAHAIETVRKQGGGPGAPVVYDSGRTPAGQNMMDLEKTVLEHPKERSPVQRSMAPVG
jgi:serine/threonine-protein kinase